jgi:hypothetical protein
VKERAAELDACREFPYQSRNDGMLTPTQPINRPPGEAFQLLKRLLAVADGGGELGSTTKERARTHATDPPKNCLNWNPFTDDLLDGQVRADRELIGHAEAAP